MADWFDLFSAVSAIETDAVLLLWKFHTPKYFGVLIHTIHDTF